MSARTRRLTQAIGVRSAVFWLFCSISSSGEPARAAPRAVVEIRVVAELGRDPVLRARIASWFERGRFDVHVQPARVLDTRRVLTPERAAVVWVWVTRESEKLVRLYFVSQPRGSTQASYLLRDLPLPSGLDEIAAEQLAEALNLSTHALLEGEQASSRGEVEQSLRHEAKGLANGEHELPASADSGNALPPPRRTTTRTIPPGPSQSESEPAGATPVAAFQLAEAFGYGLELRGEAGVHHGPHARLSGLFAHGLGLQLQAQGLLPGTHAIAGLDLQLYGAALCFALSYRSELGRSFLVEGTAGPGVELIHYTARKAQNISLNANSPETQVRGQLVLGGSVAWGSWPRVGAFGELALGLTQAQYTLTSGVVSTTAVPAGRAIVAHVPQLMPTFGLDLEF